MKFEENLMRSATPEWRRAYLDYAVRSRSVGGPMADGCVKKKRRKMKERDRNRWGTGRKKEGRKEGTKNKERQAEVHIKRK